MLEPVSHRKTLSEHAYEQLRDAITHLRLEPGQMVYETELSQQLNMSRTPIREAFRMLLAEELIEVLPQRGGRISLISEQKVEEVRLVRNYLETNAIRIAAKAWQQSDPRIAQWRRQAETLFEEQRNAVSRNDMIQFLQADEQFHRLLLSMAGNQTLITVVSSMRGHLNRLRLLCLNDLNTGAALVEEHEALFEAVRSGDGDIACEVLTGHLGKLHDELPVVKNNHPNYFKP